MWHLHQLQTTQKVMLQFSQGCQSIVIFFQKISMPKGQVTRYFKAFKFICAHLSCRIELFFLQTK